MVYHWQSTLTSGVDDMTLLPKINDESIVENLKKRFMDDWIFTYIGPVLISINPFKQMPYFSEKEILMYQGAAQYENRPHIYSTADNMYRNMLIDLENQCVIISGESGAGKTVNARYIMNYISKISGGGSVVQHVKDVILESNPLLEAFGNAKTVRNNNSSRFGKYVEIMFNSGQPTGGKISNFLLEKSRVVSISSLERSFHVFYQLCSGASEPLRSELALLPPDNFCYLNQSPCMTVEDMNDETDFRETLNAMNTIGMNDAEQRDIFRIVAAVLHLGNIQFHEAGGYASISNKRALECPAALLQIDPEVLGTKLVGRILDGKWGRQTDRIEMTLSLEQSLYTRDALSKALYARLFDFLVQRINQAMVTNTKGYTIGILDIYGFEIFQQNGFEQFCINYVNEKLQQIFIELTLKAEQNEYVEEGIKWVPVDYFNNQIVCELIDGTKPRPGLMAIVNDVCATIHNVTAKADSDLQKKLGKEMTGHQHFQTSVEGFVIHHYAGIVSYNVQGFCDRNRDVLFADLIMMMQSSRSNFIRSLFPEQMENNSTRPTTVGTKIKTQASQLVASLMKCSPHYIRCIKPNETKRPRDWEEERVRHQVEYLGLKENVRVRRAGWAYRRVFQKFLQRYAILCNETWPSWKGMPQEGIERIMAASYMDRDQYQLGRTKIFIKAPESLFQLEELRERKFDGYARIIQRAFHKYFDKRQRQRQQEQASAIVFGKKQRRKYSINRVFVGDYIGLDHRPDLLSLVGRREKVEFCETVTKYDRRFKGAKRDLFVTTHRVLLVGREKLKQGPQKGLIVPVIKRNIQYSDILKVSLSTRQDDLVILHVRSTYDSVIESTFKTEFLTVLSKKFKGATRQDLTVSFTDSMEFTVKKEGWGGGGTRKIRVVSGSSDLAVFKVSGKVLTVEVAEGLPKNTYPRVLDNDYKSPSNRPVKPARGPGVIPISSQNRPNQYTPTNNNNYNTNNVQNPNGLQFRPNLRQPPPPPSEPAPPNQPRIPAGAFRLPTSNNFSNPNPRFTPAPTASSSQVPVYSTVVKNNSRDQPGSSNGPSYHLNQSRNNVTPQQSIAEILRTPNSGASGAVRNSLSNHKPPPGAGRPKPKPKLPKCKALYDYEAKDYDELSLKEGDVLEIVKEHDSGWWLGKNKGKEGLFPSNYVEKL